MKRYGNKFKFKSVVFIFISWPKIVNRGKKISNWIFFSFGWKIHKSCSCHIRSLIPIRRLTSLKSGRLGNHPPARVSLLVRKTWAASFKQFISCPRLNVKILSRVTKGREAVHLRYPRSQLQNGRQRKEEKICKP